MSGLFFFSSRRRHTRCGRDWSSDVCSSDLPRNAARWHMIGHLQRNKAGRAVELFDVVHGVDDAELARALDRRALSLGRRLPVLLEVNVSGESSKFGVAPDRALALAEAIEPLAGLE